MVTAMSSSTLSGSLMIQGTTSDAGKSICVAGLCRVLKRQGISVAPFKPQNMALNSAVTESGGEIGRAQALQAIACGLAPSIDFNPVLLKPTSDMKSQVIINGQVVSDLDAKRFGDIKSLAFESVIDSYRRLKENYEVVLIEGAGSPAEVNLRKKDIANMGFAEAVDCPVILIGDINRGGVFAHLTGTVNLLSQSEQKRIKGFIINQFRGNLELLQSGVDWLENYTSKKVFGVVPFIPQLKLDAEDAVNPDGISHNAEVNIKVAVLPRISNHTDFDPLKWHPNVHLEFIPAGQPLTDCDLIILPGSKNVREDLDFLKLQGWHKDIQKHLRYGGKLLGVCAGFQMLGKVIHDPRGVEGLAGSSEGLGYFNFTTELSPSKLLTQVTGICFLNDKPNQISGYEIHCGRSFGDGLSNPFAKVRDQNGNSIDDGVVSKDEQIIGTYLHGLFEEKEAVQAILEWVTGAPFVAQSWQQTREDELDRLADVFEESLDIESIKSVITN